MGLALRTSAATSHQDRRRVRSGQVVVALQISLCVVLLVGAGLLVRTLRNLETVGLGLRVSGLVVFGITPPAAARTDADVRAFLGSLTSRLRALPGVESVTLMSNRIGSGWSNNTAAIVDGRPPDAQKFSPMRWNAVGPEYFHVLGTPLLLGRDFTEADGPSAPPVVIVNETFVRRYLADRPPLGHQVSLSKPYTIVGVAANSRYTSVREADRPMAYFPYTQVPSIGGLHVELRTNGDPAALLPQARRVVQEFGPDMPLLQPMTQKDQFSESFADERLFARLATFFGVLASVLVATGLYGALACRVSRRTSEIGLRMALGAERRQVLWMMFRQGGRLALAGLALGAIASTLVGQLIDALLYGVSGFDPVAYAAAASALLGVAALANFVPALSASKIDPMRALRND